MANSIQTIMRTSAMIYAEQQQSTRSKKTVERVFIEAILVSANNQPLDIEQILTVLQEEYSLTYQDYEILPILKDTDYFTPILSPNGKNDKYYMPHQRYERSKQKSEQTIEKVIEHYVSNVQKNIDPDVLKQLLFRYLYSLLNTNIDAFQQLLEKQAQKVSSVIDSSTFDEDEVEQINAFLKWDDETKDEALFALVCYCIDYASAINKVDQHDVISALKNKCLYLDNSLLYRALGINGTFRQSRVHNLLKRCVDSGQHIYISSVTRKEFFDTINYHINALNQSTPYGSINPQLFIKYSDGHGFYNYYHEWRRNRTTYGFKTLELFIHSEYEQFIKKYSIKEDFKQPYDDEDEQKTIESYTDGIQQQKNTKHQNLHENDARNILWIEKARGNNDYSIRDTKYYFVTSDRKLQEWDLTHSKNQPVTMLPSQWLALLLKFYSRSTDDYKCFVSFLTIPKDKVAISPEELQDTLAGISEITEDFTQQDDIVSALLDIEGSNNYRNREAAKRFAKEKLEDNYLAIIRANEAKHQEEIEKIQNITQQRIEAQKQESEKILATIRDEFAQIDNTNRVEKLNDKIEATKKEIRDLNDKKSLIMNIADEKLATLKRGLGFGLTLILIFWIYVIIHWGWDRMEMYTYIVGALLVVAPIISSLITNKSFNPNTLLLRYRNKIFAENCRLYNYSDAMMEDCTHSLNNLQKQLQEVDE
ncbi:MAG: hypothetical protein IKO26_00385 [Paludibacteraceae bacterium]|nr:hypothetical protein [Paludibacteraceae bacterium]